MFNGICTNVSGLTLADLLGNYCFPIVMCLILIYIIYILEKNHKDESDKYQKSIADLTLVVANNTSMIERLIDKLDDVKGVSNEQ